MADMRLRGVRVVLLGACALSAVLEAWAESPCARQQVVDERWAGAVAAKRPGWCSGSSARGGMQLSGEATDGIEYLKAHQNGTGSWGSTYGFVDTCTVIETLAQADPACPELTEGARWLSVQTASNYDYLARQIIALAPVPGDAGLVADLTDELLEARNAAEPDPGLPNWPAGGWGVAEGYGTDCLTTALALIALDAVGLNGGLAVNDETLTAGATNTHEWDIPDEAVKVRIAITVAGSTVRLRMKEGSPPGGGDPYFELPPGSWLIVFPDSELPFTPGHNYITIQSTGSAASYTLTASYETPTFDTRTLAEPLAYLREAQNVDGGWGLQRGQPTEFYTTLHALLALVEWPHYDFETERAQGITYLKAQQFGDGSFGYGGTPIPYVTALATLNLVRSETYPFSTETQDALTALLATQDVDGSWNQKPYDTALAALALWDHNQAPVADAGSDQNVTDADEDCLEDIALDGAGSDDIDGAIESHIWTEDDVVIATGASPVVPLAVGTHTLELTVTDSDGKTASDLVIIDIVGAGIPSDVCHCCFPGGDCQDLDALVCLGAGRAPVPGGCSFDACCLADDMCVMLDPACCAQEGGTAVPGESCTEGAACCMAEGVCATLDPLCCTLQGGNPQEPWEWCTSPQACCLPDDTCVIADALCCTNELGGTPQGAGSECGGMEACCQRDGTCVTVDILCCVNELGGTPQGPGADCGDVQACCRPDGTCVMTEILCCVSELGGTPQGPGSECGDEQACCLSDDTCALADTLCCLNELDGTPQGPGSTCTEPEACCLPVDTCATLDPECCDDLGGVPQGSGSICTELVACCFDNGSCQGLDPFCCANLEGAPQPAGSFCLGDGNENGVDDACEPVSPPAAEPGGPGCSVPGDCTGAYEGADCVGGNCYVPKNRYLSIDPAVNPLPVAYQVEIIEAGEYPGAIGRTWWVDTPVCYDYPNGDPVVPTPPTCEGPERFGWVSRLTGAPVVRDWSESPLHISGCGIAPAVTYAVAVTADGGATFSAALEIATAHNPDSVSQSWGDITGGPAPEMPGLWLPPEGATNMADVGNAIRTFENVSADTGAPPRVWVDVEANQVINLADIQFIVGAFEGTAYAGLPDLEFIGVHPADCP